MLHRPLRALPGLAVALAIALIAQPLAAWLGELLLSARGVDPTGRASPLSAIPVAVLLGLALANSAGTPAPLSAGVDIAVKSVLRIGIILVGLKLSLLDVLRIGALGVPLVIALVLFAVWVALALARRAGVSGRMGILAAASTAICGVTATLAIAPGIGADDREVAYTIANVTLFGLLAMLFYPFGAHALFADSPGSAGLFLGTAIHDTSQVMGAAIAYSEVYGDPVAMQVATVAKLTRNAMLIVVVPALTWLHARGDATAGQKLNYAKLFPTFVLGFLAMAALRTLGDLGVAKGGLAFGLLGLARWKALIAAGDKAAALALATALAGVGLSTRLSVLRGLGPRPFLLGLAVALLVGLASLVLAARVGPTLI